MSGVITTSRPVAALALACVALWCGPAAARYKVWSKFPGKGWKEGAVPYPTEAAARRSADFLKKSWEFERLETVALPTGRTPERPHSDGTPHEDNPRTSGTPDRVTPTPAQPPSPERETDRPFRKTDAPPQPPPAPPVPTAPPAPTARARPILLPPPTPFVAAAGAAVASFPAGMPAYAPVGAPACAGGPFGFRR